MTVTYWVALQPILEVCPKEMGYERGGGEQEPCWCQVESTKHLRDTIEEIWETEKKRH